MAAVLHHAGIGVLDAEPTIHLLRNQLGFELFAQRESTYDSKFVFRKDAVVFLVTKLKQDGILGVAGIGLDNADVPFSTAWSDKAQPLNNIGDVVSSVYEICFEVPDVVQTLKRAEEHGAKVVRQVTEVSDENGTVTYGIVRSIVGNVQHTIVNTKSYNGVFLPSFTEVTAVATSSVLDIVDIGPLSVDHITFAVNKGCTMETLLWYENCFDMKRLIVNRNEDSQEGLVLSDIGLKMVALEYWRCSETGLAMNKDPTATKFVIGESLASANNQVTTFLRQHKGPGVQHIGLHTNDLIHCVQRLRSCNMPFIKPPADYYAEIAKWKEIVSCGESVELLEDCGILLDSEADCYVCTDEESGASAAPPTPFDRYLMQIFTQPIFGNDTFFLEFLQRHGARGFGAGNITALWKAVHAYMVRMNASNCATRT